MKKNKMFFVILICLLFLGLIISIGQKYLSKKYVLPILMYHSVDENENITKLSVSPATFRNQMLFLKNHNYNIISLSKIVELIKTNAPIPSKTVCITFDDGFENNFTYAFTVLKELKIPATIFIISGNIDKQNYCTSEQIKEIANSGIVSIGAHTASHKFLPDIDENQAIYEIEQSKKSIENLINKPVEHFAYPGGGFNQRVRQYVISAGYKTACATNPGPKYPNNDIYALKRIRISKTSKNPIVFFIETSGFYTWIKETRDEE